MADARRWDDLRALRADRSGLAGKDAERGATFVAALEQAEQLARASRVAGHAAKPVPLFYALSQAGRAIAAARAHGGWELHGHGLRFRATAGNLLHSTIEPNGSDQTSFARVARALESPGLAGRSSVAAVWACNPDLTELPMTEDVPRGLSIPLGTRESHGPGPHIDADSPVTTGGYVAVSLDLPGATAGDVRQQLAAYPTLAEGRPFGVVPQGSAPVADSQEVVRQVDAQGVSRVNVGFECPEHTTMGEYWRRQDALCSVIERSAGWPHELVGYALPGLGAGSAPVPLLLWWALLHALSSLARYEPARWIAALNIDTSPIAWSLERVLDLAEAELPGRILDVLAPPT